MSADNLHPTTPTTEPNEAVPEVKPPVWTRYDCKYSLPKPESADLWADCLKPLLEEDEKQCKVWREEVQNLLIFAGLFSAVVTTFVVDSYKNLQPSPDQRTVDLLSQILIRLDNSSANLNQSSISSSSPVSPSPSSIRVNTLWFMSLVISLTTVLVGIVSLQWIREYEYYSGRFMPEHAFKIRNMRHESMNKWFVPQIFTCLPLLLQAALILFFVGLVDFLMHLYPRIAIPTVTVISATLFFLALTTVLPTLHYYTRYRIRRLDIPATPLPYKSPQSWVILSTAELVRKFLTRLMNRWRHRNSGLAYPLPNRIWIMPIIPNWNMFDWTCAIMRGYQVAETDFESPPSYYDAAHGLAHFISKYSRSSNRLALSAYHCFLEQHEGPNPVYLWRPPSQSHFYECLGPWKRISPILSSPAQQTWDPAQLPESARKDASLMLFLDIFDDYTHGFETMITRQKMELLIRLSGQFGVSDDLDDALASESTCLYSQLLTDAIHVTDADVLWQPVAAGVAEVTAMIHSRYSTPASADTWESINNDHIGLARKILGSGTDPDARTSGFAHRLGYAFVEGIFNSQAEQGSLNEWSEKDKESFIFLVYAIHKTMDEHPGTDHTSIITARMRGYLFKNSQDLHSSSVWSQLTPEEYSNVWADPFFNPWNSNALVPAPTQPPENPPTKESIHKSVPNLDNISISLATPSRIMLPPQTPSCGINVEPANRPSS